MTAHLREYGVSLRACNFGDTDKGSTAHDYIPFYERHLVPSEIGTLTEIGVYTGGSLRMWARWLTHARIIGIDIEPENYQIPTENAPLNVEFIEGDATEVDPWPSDVVIDDGSHHGDEQLAVFERFWPLLSSGGWFIIEDLETVFHDQFRCGQEMVSFLAHRLEDALRPYERSREQISEFHAYEQILFLKKR